MAYARIGSSKQAQKGRRLTALQLRFIEEYCDIDPTDPTRALNGTKAVLRAGYKTTNANRIASELLRHPLVSEEIKKRLDAREERLELTKDYIVQRLITLAENADKDGDQIRSLELLGKTLGIFKDRQEISGPDGAAIEYQEKKKNDAEQVASAIARLTARAGAAGVDGESDDRATG